MGEFPVTEKRLIKLNPTHQLSNCPTVCSMPYWRTDKTGLTMTECESYKKWFHCSCEKILGALFSTGKPWSCLYYR